MTTHINTEALIGACSDDSAAAGIRIDAELEPLSGPHGTVKPAVYLGGEYQTDHRWASSDDDEPTKVIVIDNVPSQANRLEEAIRSHRGTLTVPELVLDLSELAHLPAHLPREISSWHFPHRVADAYLRDSLLDGEDFTKTRFGKNLLAATPWSAAALVEWFPSAALFGYWQSHLGKNRAQTKHARCWVSEILGWQPAASDTAVHGLKGDALNLNIDEPIAVNPDDHTDWAIGVASETQKPGKLSTIGHGQIPFRGKGDEKPAPAPVSFRRITQRATVSFAQMRRLSLGADHSPAADVAARALLVALGLHAHTLAFQRAFALRSGADLRIRTISTEWLGANIGEPTDLTDTEATSELLASVREHAEAVGVPLGGWTGEPVRLTPNSRLRQAITATWPEIAE